MKTSVLLIGASGGIGSNLGSLMTDSKQYTVTPWSSKELDLNHPEQIFERDFTPYDILVNCAGHSQGTWQGFLKNTWQNQLSQINVNYISNLFLFKHYANSRKQGQFVWCSSNAIDTPSTYQSVYGGTKMASKFSLDLIATEATHIKILEAKISLTKTNMRYRNFEGTKTANEIEQSYYNNALDPKRVAQRMLDAITQQLTQVIIT